MKEYYVIQIEKKGIALLNSRGSTTDYAEQLLDLPSVSQGNLFLLTNYDASGLLVDQIKTLYTRI